jgi:MerR family transcriptional regulator, light-induced transcriptional regulator
MSTNTDRSRSGSSTHELGARTLKTREAAHLLNVSATTLRTWEDQFGYPRPSRSPGGHRAYAYNEIVLLRDALRRGLSASSAISAISTGQGADVSALASALTSFDGAWADRVLEGSLMLRPLEQSIEHVLIGALESIERTHSPGSVTCAFAARWALGWLSRAERLAVSRPDARAILVCEPDANEAEPGFAVIRALELLCVLDGHVVTAVPVSATRGLAEAVRRLEPACLLLAGVDTMEDRLARWLYLGRADAGDATVAWFRCRLGMRTPCREDGVVLSGSVVQARDELQQLLS